MSTGLLVSAGQSLWQKINIPVMAAFWVFVWSGGDGWGVVLSAGSASCTDAVVCQVLTRRFFFLLQSSNISAAAAGAQR